MERMAPPSMGIIAPAMQEASGWRGETVVSGGTRGADAVPDVYLELTPPFVLIKKK